MSRIFRLKQSRKSSEARVMISRLIGVLVMTALFSACTVGPKYQRPRVQTPQVYRGVTGPPDPQTLADTKWFDVFKDERLQELIREALVSNYDLREAVARMDAARASYGITRSNQFPTFAASADVVTERRSQSGAVDLPGFFKRERTFGSVLLNLLTFEVDVW